MAQANTATRPEKAAPSGAERTFGLLPGRAKQYLIGWDIRTMQ